MVTQIVPTTCELESVRCDKKMQMNEHEALRPHQTIEQIMRKIEYKWAMETQEKITISPKKY